MMFAWGVGLYLLGDVDFGTSFAWGFDLDGFSWGCEPGVSRELYDTNSTKLVCRKFEKKIEHTFAQCE